MIRVTLNIPPIYGTLLKPHKNEAVKQTLSLIDEGIRMDSEGSAKTFNKLLVLKNFFLLNFVIIKFLGVNRVNGILSSFLENNGLI